MVHALPMQLTTNHLRSDRINWIGLRSLYKKEVRRFINVAAQTVLGPVLSSLIFLAIFAFAVDREGIAIDGVPYLVFLAPGLIMMTMTQHAFSNTASSLLIAKLQGTIVDVLMAPLSPPELVAGFALAATTRGLLTGSLLALVIAPFVPMTVEHVAWLAFHALTATSMLSLLGILAGLWVRRMDGLAGVTSFFVMPLTFLSGTFYSVSQLPEPVQMVAHFNPFFYMIDGFRYGFIGQAESSLAIGAVVMMVLNAGLVATCLWAFALGWRLKP